MFIMLTMSTGARLHARTYTFAHPRWRTAKAERKHSAISPVLTVIFDQKLMSRKVRAESEYMRYKI